VQSVFEKADVLVQRAEEGFNFSRNVDRALHALGRFCSSRQVADGISPENFWLATASRRRATDFNVAHERAGVKV
jgi:hypothetical protein